MGRIGQLRRTTKLVYGVGDVGLAAPGWVLQLYGYVSNVEQSAHTLFAVRLFFGLVPLIFFALALPFLVWHPITRATHADIRKVLEPT